tara:strand:+ start:1394 stop:2008 length:615 start_codon:yes stop_codon:yes gene_type:complete
MIKINLIEQKKPLKIPVVLGIDITKLNWKWLVFAFLIYKIPPNFIFPRFEARQEEVKEGNNELRKENAKLIKKLGENKDLQNKIGETEKKIKELKIKTRQIENILKVKTNPKPALERVAKDIPGDLWLVSLSLNDSSRFSMTGFSYSFRSISNFIALANDSKFFNRSLGVSDSKTLVETYKGEKRRVESFAIVGSMNVFGGASK